MEIKDIFTYIYIYKFV